MKAAAIHGVNLWVRAVETARLGMLQNGLGCQDM